MNQTDIRYINMSSDGPATIALCGSASRSVSVVCRKDPIRVKLVPFSLNVTVTFSFSRACFFSRHIAKAQPTAWLSRSPYSQQFITTPNDLTNNTKLAAGFASVNSKMINMQLTVLFITNSNHIANFVTLILHHLYIQDTLCVCLCGCLPAHNSETDRVIVSKFSG